MMDILVYGTINGAILAVMALGFALVYGVSRLPNFAHGALYILTGYIAWALMNKMGLNHGLAVVISIVTVTLVGALLYRFLLIRVRGMPISEIMASFAIGLAIMESLRWRGIGQAYILPPFFEGVVLIGDIPVDLQRLVILAMCGSLALFLWFFTRHTKIGLSMSAIAQDKHAAMMLGMDADRTASIAMAFGSALAGLAAVVVLPLGNITVETGYEVLIYAVAVAATGGLGSWPGTLLAAFIIGFAQTGAAVYMAPQYQMVVIFLAIILIFMIRPSGLFGRQNELKERV
ncbi:Branched-chain amino acid ABC transporter permease [Candidatus Desulfarcum epimagneticum]|uniref:Branched-chain amino acid ABC transporter permease n=1 Tax=uncultured Desulfobacteraceae bacterium TaxID=218296 RepID=A0A484HEU0_9BACT|nr:Branched-chain amino acid ABC transporter permease [uncultured Desulfobacteraceae bacterium]